jgi:CRISPR/Cas system-associated exonuclease Cas4 (RecB family)
MFLRCPAQFEKRYIHNMIIPPGVSARKGTSVHTGAEHNYKHVVSKGEQAPLDEVQDATHDEFMRLVKDEGVWFSPDELPEKEKILYKSLDESIQSATFYHKTFAKEDKEIALVERRLKASIPNGDMILSGKPDVVADGKLIDIKTAGKRWNPHREDYEIQPTIYKLLLRENGFGDLDAEYRVITNASRKPKSKGVIWDDETKVCGDVRKAERTKEHELGLYATIDVITKMLDKGMFPPAPPSSWWCTPKWCGYFSLCPYVSGRKYI